MTISLHEGAPVAIELPQSAVLEMVETEPAMKGQTAASSYKPAMLSNGVRTMVPPFVTTGTKIVVMHRRRHLRRAGEGVTRGARLRRAPE